MSALAVGGGRRAALVEVLVAFCAVSLTTVGIAWVGRLPGLADYVHLLVGAVFLGSAIQLAQRRPGGLERYGISLGGLLTPSDPAPSGPLGPLKDLLTALWRAAPAALRETGFALALCAAIFPPFSVGYYMWHQPTHPFSWTPPPDLASYLLAQLLVVALPEEAFFRGYLEGRLGDAERRRVRVLGAELAPRAFLLQALLFGTIHVAVDLNPVRFAVCVPALLFAWVRRVRGGVGAALVVHALCNLLSDVLARGFA